MKAIIAKDDQWGIGLNQSLPWPHNPDDMKWFKTTTIEKTIIMGRNTWESLGVKKPLPNRKNIVISSQEVEGCDGQLTLDQLTRTLDACPEIFEDAYVIGGAQLFHGLIDYIDTVYITNIPGVYNCDTFLVKDSILSTFECVDELTFNSLSISKYVKK